MVLKQYKHNGSTFQFEEGEQPKGALEVDGPASADGVHLDIDEAFQKAEAERTAAAATADAAVDEDGVDGSAPAEGEKQAPEPKNKARAPRNKAVTTEVGTGHVDDVAPPVAPADGVPAGGTTTDAPAPAE